MPEQTRSERQTQNRAALFADSARTDGLAFRYGIESELHQDLAHNEVRLEPYLTPDLSPPPSAPIKIEVALTCWMAATGFARN